MNDTELLDELSKLLKRSIEIAQVLEDKGVSVNAGALCDHLCESEKILGYVKRDYG